MKKILLVDGNSMLFKAYYGTAYGNGMMHALDGTPTNAIFAFANMLTRHLKNNDYYTVVVCFDKNKKTFRHEMMEDYKGGRSKTPSELIAQFPLVREYLLASNIPYIEMDNYEADDLIGCLAKRAEREGFLVDVLSSDKDMFQLISDNIHVLVTRQGVSNNEEFDKEKLFEKWHVTPEQVTDLKGLMGDPSDNLKGIPGIGEKTAIKLINDYHDIDNMYAHVDEISAKLADKIKTHIDAALLCKKVATIICDLPLEQIEFTPLSINAEQMNAFYQKYDMNSLVDRGSIKTLSKVDRPTIVIVDQCSVEMFSETNVNAVFLEVFEDNYHTSPIIGWSWANDKGCFYQSFEKMCHDDLARDFFASEKYVKSTYDLKKTICALDRYDFVVKGIEFDLMLACYVFNPNVKNTFDTYVQLILQEHMTSDDVFYDRGVKKSIPADEQRLADFIGSKACYIQKLQPMLERLLASAEQTYLYEKIELPCAIALAQMELNGVSVDLVELNYQCLRVKALVDRLASEIQQLAGYEINPNSPKQLKELLFDKLNLPDGKKGSTAQEALESISHTHPVVNVLLDYRKYQKLYSTYLEGMKKFLFPDNKVHTIYKQTLTNTGRLSSIEPNMQNISVHDPIQKEVRKIFVSDSDKFTLMSCDYSQIELRVLAHMSQDQSMIDAFNQGEDIHTNTAMKVFHLQRDQIDDHWRRKAKAVNFGIIYGISDFGLSRDLSIGVKEAKEIIENYYQQFPTIKNYINKQVEFCQKNGYVTTMFNRKRYVPEITDRNYMTREFGKRVAMNMPIQGTAADIIKLSLNNIDHLFKEKKLKSRINAQVHDELIFEVYLEEKAMVQNLVQNAMENVLELSVVLKVDTKFGNNWYNIK